MSVSAHIAAQRTDHAVPHAVSCRALGVAPSTFYKWHNPPPTPAKRRRGLTRPDKRAAPVPDLLRRDFTAGGVNEKWVGDFKQIDTGEGPVFLATVEDLFSRRMLGFAQSDRHPTAQLATDALNMAAAVRGGTVAGVIFHTDKLHDWHSAHSVYADLTCIHR